MNFYSGYAHSVRMLSLIWLICQLYSGFGLGDIAKPTNCKKPHRVGNNVQRISLKAPGAQVAIQGSHPWMAGLFGFYGADAGFCGGAILNSCYIVTAAHCVQEVTGKKCGGVVTRITLGARELTQLVPGFPQKQDNLKVISGGGWQATCHPFSKFSDVLGHNDSVDIALLRLNKCLPEFTENVMKRICLPKTPLDDLHQLKGETMTCYGWGAVTESNTFRRTLQQATPSIVGRDICTEVLDIQGGFKLPNAGLCSVPNFGGTGDSGSPCVIKDCNNTDCLVGIISGRRFSATVTASLRHPAVLNWIKETVRSKPCRRSCIHEDICECGTLPVADDDGVKCPQLDPIVDAPSNGTLKVVSNTPGSLALYDCINGRQLLGPIVRACLPDGKWSEEPPTCRAGLCVKGDPHVKHFLSAHNVRLCYTLRGKSGEVLTFFSDKDKGILINGQYGPVSKTYPEVSKYIKHLGLKIGNITIEFTKKYIRVNNGRFRAWAMQTMVHEGVRIKINKDSMTGEVMILEHEITITVARRNARVDFCIFPHVFPQIGKGILGVVDSYKKSDIYFGTMKPRKTVATMYIKDRTVKIKSRMTKNKLPCWGLRGGDPLEQLLGENINDVRSTCLFCYPGR
ncbi:unnamed protein product [Owenia fusiformis]|uniref:Uncharacterized protein n=1 Tax=Owenia fusiformis TaxID=6347 RepID=A0A8J1U9I8_OWEFU|nr:unnamed protein product [Owenia fusiformis]